MAGYVLARQNMPGSKLMFLAVLGLLMVPSQITLVPLYLMLSKLNLVDTYTGLILPLAANAFGIFVMKQFIQSIPRDYDEAAMIDGASKFRLFLWVILPLARPALLVVAVTMFMETWNNFIFPLVMITNNQMKTVTLGLADFTYATLNVNWGVTMAGSLLGALPAILLFVVLNRYFMEGLSLGGGIRG
ncbi:MAG: carbohydrate ABC transporter permease [Firmicutes bacterium]|nr:carbohydrate ABC transporter permease [Bacillota bacterium]